MPGLRGPQLHAEEAAALHQRCPAGHSRARERVDDERLGANRVRWRGDQPDELTHKRERLGCVVRLRPGSEAERCSVVEAFATKKKRDGPPESE